MTRGVLVISHGSPNISWVQKIDGLLNQLKIRLPTEAAFLGMVEDRTIQKGIERLEAKGVEEILAIPLFVSSGSTHLSEIQYALGLIDEPGVETDLKPLLIRARVIWAEPMDDHPIIREILRDRVQELSDNPAEEVLLLAAHGSDVPGFKERWERMLGRLASGLRRELGLNGATYATIHPDTLARRARAVSKKNRLLIVPVFLSPGYYTEKAMPGKLDGIVHRYNGKAYLPDARIARWIEETIAAYL
ncbi:sirohydrochlorin chelatase [Aneurinibacillus sp. UBA3580]|jgi:sirohydrochlorin ferrochelatase|uniref:sirohydrochlorin chelatase n=1 Tax=Aneurinibacillus sp. UBA3580 TaxID=1946041 RepID=UPI0025797050|nr:CbiX/SirB N-terminal domain-containing protein [Aneurinibacillus sp. UBA3580]